MNDADYEKIKIRLGNIPNFAEKEYHPEQVRFYAKMTELIYKVLNTSTIRKFINEIIDHLNIKENIEIRIMRLPSRKSLVFEVENKLVGKQLHGRAWRDKPLIDIFPNLVFPDKFSRPKFSVKLRKFIFSGIVRGVIHEILHKSGLRDEDKVRKLTLQYYKEFQNKYLECFKKELKPLIREWMAFGEIIEQK